jgi:hypothetical protein
MRRALDDNVQVMIRDVLGSEVVLEKQAIRIE